MYEPKPSVGFCRACLVKYEDPLDLLQYSERNRRLFVYITGLQVKRNDNFIFQLCKDCFSLLRTAGNFKKKCRTSDKTIRSFMGLRNAGEDIDFCNFLKNNDDSHTFRLPFMSGNSTPAFHKTKDDDNVSTCTSIRNFMKDILKEDEIADREARIIKEVIQEEADISEDSLDSQWLRDDISINEDFSNLDFSPFSTPKIDIKEHYPSLEPDLSAKKSHLSAQNQDFGKPHLSGKNTIFNESESCDTSLKLTTLTDNVTEIPVNPKYVMNYYTAANKVPVKCSIDKKLDLALKDEENESFFLDDLLKSPAALKGKQLPGAETPTINNILFGQTLETNAVETTTEKYLKEVKEENTDSEFLDTNCEENNVALPDFSFELTDIRSISVKEEQSLEEIRDSFYIKTFYCKLCGKQLKTYAGLVHHCRFIHKHVIPSAKGETKFYICDTCGKKNRFRTNFINHLKTHEEKERIACPICSLKFVGQHILKTHMRGHETLAERRADKNKSETKFVCPSCGKSFSSRQNLSIHKRRHGDSVHISCDKCKLGFHRKYDYKVHMRTHTGEKPYVCNVCNKKFSRCDTLSRHYKIHLGGAPKGGSTVVGTMGTPTTPKRLPKTPKD